MQKKQANKQKLTSEGDPTCFSDYSGSAWPESPESPLLEAAGHGFLKSVAPAKRRPCPVDRKREGKETSIKVNLKTNTLNSTIYVLEWQSLRNYIYFA